MLFLFRISRLCNAADSDSSKINSGVCGALQGTFITPLIISTKLLGQSMHLDCPSECSICFLACSCHSTCQSYVGDCLSFCSICPSVCCSFSVGAICLSFFQDGFFDLLSLLFLSIWHSSMATMGLAFPRDSVFCVANWSIREELRNHSR